MVVESSKAVVLKEGLSIWTMQNSSKILFCSILGVSPSFFYFLCNPLESRPALGFFLAIVAPCFLFSVQLIFS